MTTSPGASFGYRSNEARFTATLFLSQSADQMSALPSSIGAFMLKSVAFDPRLSVPLEPLRASDLCVVEISADGERGIERLTRALAVAEGRPIIAAIANPTVDQVRSLMRAGAADVLPTPLQEADLRSSLQSLTERVQGRYDQMPRGRVVTFIKSKGGIGGTTVATQVAAAAAVSGASGRVALLDFDLQLGCAALYLGIVPHVTLGDVIGSAERLDGSALRSVMTAHPSGLEVLAAPPETIPLDSLSVDEALAIVEVAAREFDTVFIDGPLDWTDWSMSVMARSDQLVMLTDLSLAGLHNGRRRLDLLRQQGLGDIPLQLVITRVEKRRFRALSFKDAETALGRAVDHSIAEDDVSVSESLTQGRLLRELHPGARATKDFDELAERLTAKE